MSKYLGGNIGSKDRSSYQPLYCLYTYINRHAGTLTPESGLQESCVFAFPFFLLFFFLGDVTFSEYFCTITVLFVSIFVPLPFYLSLFCTITVFLVNGEYIVRFFLPDGVFLPRDHGLDFLHQLV